MKISRVKTRKNDDNKVPRGKLKPKPRMPKSAAEPHREAHTELYYARVDNVFALLCENPRWLEAQREGELTKIVLDQLNKNVAEKDKLSADTARRYISAARELWVAKSEKNREAKFRKAIHQREFVYRLAFKEKDFASMLKALKERDVLEGIYTERSATAVFDLGKASKEQLERIALGEDPTYVFSTDDVKSKKSKADKATKTQSPDDALIG